MSRFFPGTQVSKGLVLAFLSFLIFSCGDAVVKHVSQNYSVILILFWGQLTGLFLLVILASIDKNGVLGMIRSRQFGWHILRGVIMSGQVFCIFYAFSSIPMAQAYSFVFAAPIFSTVLTRLFLKEEIPFKKWAALFTGFAGIIVILRPGFITIEIGMLSALLSGFLFASGYVLGRFIGSKEAPYTFGFYPFLMAFLLSTLFLAFGDGKGLYIPHSYDLMLMMMTGAASAIALLFLSWAFNYAPVPSVSSFQYTQMIWGTMFGWLIFGELPDIWTYVGGLLIIASGAYMIWHDQKAQRNYPLT